MGDLSLDFSRHEFACKCGCGFDTVDAELLQMVQEIRNHFDKPVIIDSGCRCPEHNKRVKGKTHSQHLLGRAADIRVKDIDPALVAEIADQLGFNGVGMYDTFTHIDSGPPGRRWGTWREIKLS